MSMDESEADIAGLRRVVNGAGLEDTLMSTALLEWMLAQPRIAALLDRAANAYLGDAVDTRPVGGGTALTRRREECRWRPHTSEDILGRDKVSLDLTGLRPSPE